MEHEVERLYHRSGRMLGLNSPESLQDCQQLLQKLIENIKNDPTNDKFHKIKLSNSAIQSRIVGRSGCLEFLGAIGFKSKEIDHEKHLYVDIGAPECLQRLELGLDWLQSTVATCLSVATAGRDTCMECVIQITLVSGIRVTGGFMRNDTLLDVLSFVKCFYNSDKAADIVLHLPNSASEDLTCNRLTATLEELNLYPRALLISSSLDSNDRREKLHEVQQEVKDSTKEIVLKNKQIQQEKIKKFDDEKKHREAIINQFKEDRHK